MIVPFDGQMIVFGTQVVVVANRFLQFIHSIQRRLVGASAPHPQAIWQKEEAELGLRHFEQLGPLPHPILSVICDDGAKADLEIAATLDQLGVKGVFAISPLSVGTPESLTWEDILDLNRRGHEIAYHGLTHDSLTDYADELALEASFHEGIALFQAQGLPRPVTMVYPSGHNHAMIRKVVSRHFEGAFTTWYGENTGPVNRYAVRRIALGAYVEGCPGSTSWYLGWLNRLSRQPSPCWGALMLHPGASEHQPTHTAQLRDVVAAAVSQKISVQTARDTWPAQSRTA